jgi:hypothetical protein
MVLMYAAKGEANPKENKDVKEERKKEEIRKIHLAVL